jgi:hypothetical protein
MCHASERMAALQAWETKCLGDPQKTSTAGAAEAVATIDGGSNATAAVLLPGKWVAFQFGRRTIAAEVVSKLAYGRQRRRRAAVSEAPKPAADFGQQPKQLTQKPGSRCHVPPPAAAALRRRVGNIPYNVTSIAMRGVGDFPSTETPFPPTRNGTRALQEFAKGRQPP